MSVNKPIVFPNVKPGPDRRHVHAVGSLYRFIIVVVLDFVRRVDVVAVIHEMHAVERHMLATPRFGARKTTMWRASLALI
jgi:protein tyrosine phosphatase (PTP) superfamily phosphohydrolase (DUF442 family)